MPEMTLLIDGDEVTFPTKKEMMIQAGKMILSSSDEPMTLRQLYYRFVALDLVENKQSQYQYLGDAIKEARLDGRIPWGWIEDRTRSIEGGDDDLVSPRSRFESNLDWFRDTPRRYRMPRWHRQPVYVEVWVEKEALAGVFSSACEDLNVVTFPNRGYTSVTLLHEAAERMRPEIDAGRDAEILYFGDFDPSGQDIERNIREKLQGEFSVPVNVTRVALTRKQIDEHGLPPQPAKRTDARYDDFVERHGDMAVELDALPPEELRRLIRSSVEARFDSYMYEEEVLPIEKKHRAALEEMIEGALS